ncbi:MAG: 4'-phosphopantetheinyl transferase superfamily protein [Kovacikia sp.]
MSSVLHPEWTFAPDRLTLPPHVIHIWRASLNLSPLQLGELAQTLSTDELQRADRFRFESDRHRFIAARGTLRAILGRYLEIAPGQIQFHYAVHGKPAIAMPATDPAPRPFLEFNLSHSQDLMVCAITRHNRVGIDLEYLHPIPNLEGLTRRFYSAQEYSAIQGLSADQQVRSFFQHWTCKEAFLKAIGEGLGELSQVEVLIDAEQAQLIQCPEQASPLQQWLLHLFTPAPGYIAALAGDLAAPECPSASWNFLFWDWQEQEE